MMVLYLVLLLIIFFVSGVLLFSCDYEDGIVGKLALGAMWVLSAGVLIDSTDDVTYQPLAVNVMLTLAFTLFLVRHFYRWLQFTRSGKFAWKKREP